MMERRLKIAKDLLSDDGIICCAIDDYEVHNLRMLMDEIFGEDSRL
jgi:adenine-specific DNA-methyltransferase